MKKPRRYNRTPFGMDDDENGQWIEYSEYEYLIEALEALTDIWFDRKVEYLKRRDPAKANATEDCGNDLSKLLNK